MGASQTLKIPKISTRTIFIGEVWKNPFQKKSYMKFKKKEEINSMVKEKTKALMKDHFERCKLAW